MPAWNALTYLAVAVLTEAIRDCGYLIEDARYPNRIRMTSESIRRRWKVGHPKARATLLLLEETGWIARVGLSPGPTGQVGGVYQLNMLTVGLMPCNGPFIQWRPQV